MRRVLLPSILGRCGGGGGRVGSIVRFTYPPVDAPQTKFGPPGRRYPPVAYFGLYSRPYLFQLRTPNNVQLKWASEGKKMVRAFRKGCDNIETEEGKASYKVLVNNEKAISASSWSLKTRQSDVVTLRQKREQRKWTFVFRLKTMQKVEKR